ncbi:adenylate/guanylate cyclase domain-containing protein [Leptospira congkakensis]|uniref:Adenylate/guanylate cyclase domain-containing protein n=1 Tax=Leptospira congkakensis TaxID=2484932 RepID=A0A4Z1A590_9LEPT|nr:adenylate/guanylate cyclase domain-containing protein [Leptospira congkakensis]TGL87143.1 adenylate/guanylate cyclase domain-containing protein [Leptospira congkakensis]TGL96711.1 adenylate/guanylate cyclase domain-containing protein [Leptospira congkakensis]TGL97560.1 adenylate/guanylate cyclase domain-containing protein [Leptospira congkakensis]
MILNRLTISYHSLAFQEMFPAIHNVVVLIAISFCTMCSAKSGQSQSPIALAGTMDLSVWSWSQGPVSLDGEWTLNEIPWEVPSTKGFHGNPIGYGVYRLKIKLPDSSSDLAILSPLVGTAFSLSVDGDVIAEEGKISSVPGGGSPSYRPRVILIPKTDKSEINLMVEVSNWDDQFGGIYYSLRLGTLEQIQMIRTQAIIWEALLFGAIFLMGLYHCGSFFFRSQNRAPLWFGVFCLMISFRSTLYSETLFLEIFPDVSWYFVIRGVYATMALALVSFAAFVDRLYPRHSYRPITILTVTGGIVYAIINVVAPIVWTTKLLVPFQLLLVFYGIYSLITVGRALIHKEPGAGLFVGGTGIFLFTVLLDIVKSHFFWNLPSLVNVGTLVFILAQSLVVARLFANAFATSEMHSAALERINSSLERFIPREVLGFLNKKSITEIVLGDFSEMKMTVFFLDIRNFTGLSESMSPKENFKFINSFLKLFGPIIRDHNGFVDKYMGDGIMALFPGPPDESLAAAIAMRHTLREYNDGRVRGGYQAVEFGIGIHTGPLMLGTIGENRRMDSTVISDTVNAASRLEGLTKKYSVDILVSGSTIAGLEHPEEFHTKFIAEETVKGKLKPMEVFLVT